MPNFKKVLLSVLCVIFVISVLSSILFIPYLNSEMGYYQDSKSRDSLAGKLDYLVVGASNGLCAFDPRVLDEKLGVSSYNLSGTLMTLGAKEFFLQKEISRNPVKTVVMDISFETLTRNEREEYAGGDAVSLAKCGSMQERLQFVLQYVHFSDWLNLYGNLATPGIEYLLTVIKGSSVNGVEKAAKGFYGREVNDITLSEDEAKQNYNITHLNTEFRSENIEKLVSQIQACQQQGIQVILAVVPKSDRDLWKFDQHDVFYQWMMEFSKENDCDFYDFNLLKMRYEILNDEHSFFDATHMSEEGATMFSKACCDIIKRAETEDVSEYFYDSYEEMKADSPYMEYLK